MKSSIFFTKNKKGTKCLNCDSVISENDNFCPNCGQVNDESRLSLKQYFSEYLSGFFSFDNRFINTVLPLLFKPGKVTREYIDGKRKKYVNPFQLYLHITIVYFLILGIFGSIDKYKLSNTQTQANEIIPNIDTDDAILVFDTIKSTSINALKKNAPELGETEIDNIDAQIDSVKNIIQASMVKKDSFYIEKTQTLKIYIDSVFSNTNYIREFKNEELSRSQKDSIFDILFNDINSYTLNLLTGKKNQIKNNPTESERINEFKEFTIKNIKNTFKENDVKYIIPNRYLISFENNFLIKAVGERFYTKMYDFIKYDNKNDHVDIPTALNDLGYEKNYWNNFWFSKALNINKMIDDPEFRQSYLENIISKISIALFFLLPFFTLIVALLYIRSRYHYSEHLVFVFHTQTVFFILLIFFTVFDRIFKTDMGSLLFIFLFLFYLYKAIRNFYKQGKFKTMIKFSILNIYFIVIATIGGVIISFIVFVI